MSRTLAARRAWLGGLAALGSAATFALNLVLARLVYDHGGNIHALNLVRPFAFIAVVGIALAVSATPLRLRGPAHLTVGLLGVLMAAELYALLGAIHFLPVSVAILLNYCYPMLIAAWAWSRGLERPSAGKAACLLAAFAGLALVLLAPGGAMAGPGIALALGAGAVLASMLIVGAHAMATNDRRVVMLHALVVTAALMVGLCATVVELRWPADAIGWWAFVLSTACFAIATYLLFTAVALIGPLRTAVIDNTSPIWALVFGALLLGEVLDARQYAGVAVVVGAIVMLQILERPRPAQT